MLEYNKVSTISALVKSSIIVSRLQGNLGFTDIEKVKFNLNSVNTYFNERH